MGTTKTGNRAASAGGEAGVTSTSMPQGIGLRGATGSAGAESDSANARAIETAMRKSGDDIFRFLHGA